MNVKIRSPRKDELTTTLNITREAFWNLYEPGCSEHLILEQLRQSEDYIRGLDLVAERQGELVGSIIATRAKVIGKGMKSKDVLCVGPLSVLPDLQGKGIGAKLMLEIIRRAERLNFKGLILLGDPDYYHRFGFVNAKQYDITTKDGQNFDPFMALELHKGSLKGVKGMFYESEDFEVTPKEVEAFDKSFPKKEKGPARKPVEL